MFSIGAGSTAGAALVTLGVAVLRFLQAAGAPNEDLAFATFAASALAGIGAAAAFGWAHSRRIDDRWRRAVTGAVSVFGAVLLAVVAIPIDLVTGPVGLVVYVAFLVAALTYFHRLATRTG